MVRGMSPVRAPFTYASYCPEVLARISEVAGVKLVLAFEFDMGNVNISVNDPSSTQGPDGSKCDDLSTFAWHYDSFRFVCVTIETMIKTGTGENMKVRWPTMGTAVVMQGRYIKHRALKALGGRERISMVTAFRPKSPFVKDETGVRGTSDLSKLYSQYTMYRLEVFKERTRAKMKTERQREDVKHSFDIDGTRKLLMELC